MSSPLQAGMDEKHAISVQPAAAPVSGLGHGSSGQECFQVDPSLWGAAELSHGWWVPVQ